ncbi:GDSL esterase/lipase At4g10955-like [Prosopis cineraria]|uniref:GDSL esterase/lipase At4g10955-like n=1 Tax=Prosopis cineraria TaxID=364024 RepID=UPI00240F1406|nr:GDSL esterase/lipase At4g10955-like [Prosopis cineraria]
MAKAAKRGLDERPQDDAHHPYAFHVSGPRNFSLSWRDLLNSSWKDENYKRIVIACFIQAVYLLELDKQENRTKENALAPNWWIPFKYKLTQTLIDERDGSIFGAIFEWDQRAAMADLLLARPSGAPRAVLALRGTLLKTPTIRRDIEDDLRFLAWESLKGSSRFKLALEVLKSVSKKYGSSNVCIAGHSLGAGFALQVGKALAKERIYVETHLFNPPSVSLAMSLRYMGKKAESIWKRLKLMLPSSSVEGKTLSEGLSHQSTSLNTSGSGLGKWIPYLYVNDSDYICCYYTSPDDVKGSMGISNGQVLAKMFVVSKEKQKFLEAHGLAQWWSSDAELQLAIQNSKLISRQLRSLYMVATS